MNDEIKEIDRVLLNVKRKLQSSPERRFVELFNKDEINKLLDYITNLQHTEDLYNQLLKDYDELQQELEDYKSRCEKAVEYIEHSKFIKEQVILRSNYDMQDFQIRELLNILNGKE